MTVRWLKEQLDKLPDDTLIVVQSSETREACGLATDASVNAAVGKSAIIITARFLG